MRKITSVLFTIFVSLAVFSTSNAAKLTTDPNTIVKKPALVVEDKRLDQKVTYEAAQKRLHTVTDELSKLTGVTIRSGESSKDWQTRDVPVTIYAKNLPLRLLLHSIAESSHLQLVSYDADKVRCYRIKRDPAQSKALEEYRDKEKQAWLNKTAWEIDVLSKIGNMSDSDYKTIQNDLKDFESQDNQIFHCMAKVAASLSSKDREKLLNGENVALKIADLPAAQAELVKLYYLQSRQVDQLRRELLKAEIAKDGIQNETVAPGKPEDKIDFDKIKLNISGEYGLNAYFSSPGENIQAEPRNGLQYVLNRCGKDTIKSPKWPDVPQSTYSSNLRQLNYPEYTHMPVLQTKLDIDKPNDKQFTTYADGFIALAKTSGFSIVCEDYISQRYNNSDGDGAFGKQIVFGNALDGSISYDGMQWYMDEQNKLIVGSSYDWYENVINLVPEAQIMSLKEKMDTCGAELDDIAFIKCLTDGQYDDWIQQSNIFTSIMQTSYVAKTNNVSQQPSFYREYVDMPYHAQPRQMPFWQLYNSLSPEDKALAKSQTGFPFAKLDPQVAGSIFAEATKDLKKDENDDDIASKVDRSLEMHPELRNEVYDAINKFTEAAIERGEDSQYLDTAPVYEEMLEKHPELKSSIYYPKNPADIAKLSLYIEQKDEGTGIYKYHTYSMSVKGPNYSILIDRNISSFPFYSPARRRQVLQEKTEELLKKRKADTQQ